MIRRIHFKDNLFYMTRILDTISDGLLLDLDTEFFLDKFVDDILFFNSILNRAYNTLQQNSDLVEFCEQLRNLYSIQQKYCMLLSRIINKETVFHDEFRPFILKFTEILHAVEASSRDIQSEILNNTTSSVKNSDLVSQHELATLFQMAL